MAADAPRTGERHDGDLAGRQRGQGRRQGRAGLLEPSSHELRLRATDEPQRRRVRERHALFEVEHDDAGGRRREDAREQALLLLVARALLAQGVGHAVVDADEAVHLRLAHLAHARRELALGEQARRALERLEAAAHPPQQPEADQQRGREQPLDREQPGAVLLAQHEPRDQRELGVDDDEVRDEAAREAHAWSPYFSSRR